MERPGRKPRPFHVYREILAAWPPCSPIPKRQELGVELLGNVRLFSTRNKRELARIASLVEEVDAPKGQVLVRQGDPGRECFVIAEGRASAAIGGKGSQLLGPGSFFGEMSLLDQGPRSATVTAETDTHLLVLGSREFSSSSTMCQRWRSG